MLLKYYYLCYNSIIQLSIMKYVLLIDPRTSKKKKII